MLQSKIPFTQEAYEKMSQEEHRLEVERLATLERLKIAREQGDLSENGAYRYAKQELGNLGRQLRQLHFLLRTGTVIATKSHSKVEFGATVTITDGTKPITYQIVSQYESDPASKKLSMESPLGAAMLGLGVGQSFVFQAPVGEKHFTITAIV